MERRRFIQALTVGLVALSTPHVVDKGLEMIARAGAEEPKKAPISEVEFERLMKYDTVDDILSEYGIGSVDDSSYKRKVYDSNKHVMVLFYDNCGRGAKGLGILFGLLSKKFASKFNVYGYKMSEECEHTPRDVFEHVTKTYGAKHTPFVALYESNNGESNKKETLEKGISNFAVFIKAFKVSHNYISSNFK